MRRIRRQSCRAETYVDLVVIHRHDVNAVELGLVRLVLNCIAAAFLVSRIVSWDAPHDDPTVKLSGRRLKLIAFSRVVH